MLPAAPDFEAFKEEVAPNVARMEAELGGAPAGRSVPNPDIGTCFSPVSNNPLLFESVPTSHPVPLASTRKLIGLFRRTASKRVNFSVSDKRAAAASSW